MKRRSKPTTELLDLGDKPLDINLYQAGVSVRTLRTLIVSGPVAPKLGERITLEIVGIEKAQWETA